MLDIQLSKAKIFYDQDQQAQEVLISYDTFRYLERLLAQLREHPQGYFWSEEWQTRIREGEADIQAGRTLQVTGENIEHALEWLDE
ncbi:MAG TPA: hypothetical protein G4N98_10150 [Thermoflexia bacterium]|nr:hypothetical protein [Thermoflexia bacterium]